MIFSKIKTMFFGIEGDENTKKGSVVEDKNTVLCIIKEVNKFASKYAGGERKKEGAKALRQFIDEFNRKGDIYIWNYVKTFSFEEKKEMLCQLDYVAWSTLEGIVKRGAVSITRSEWWILREWSSVRCLFLSEKEAKEYGVNVALKACNAKWAEEYEKNFRIRLIKDRL